MRQILSSTNAMNLRAAFLLFATIIYIKPSLGLAQYSKGIISQSMGESGRASVDPIEISQLNPAGLVHLPHYHAGISYWRTSPQKGDSSNNLSVALADANRNSGLPGGFTYVRQDARYSSGGFKDQYFHAGVAGFLLNNVSVGLSAHYLMNDPDFSASRQKFDTDLGFLWNPFTGLGLALVGYNLVGKGKNDPLSTDTNRQVAVGASIYNNQLFQVRLDYIRKIQNNTNGNGVLAGGFESSLPMGIKLRFGGREDGVQNKTFFTAGAGWHTPRLKFDYSFQRDTRKGQEVTHGIDMWLHF